MHGTNSPSPPKNPATELGGIPNTIIEQTGRTARPDPPVRPNGLLPRILIVEDGLIIAEDMRRRCESLGYRVVATVSSGEEAVDMAQVARPDLVLMDIRLAGFIDGIEAARRIRDLLDIPVVYITSYSDDATLDRAKRTGPFGYMLKPIEPRELHTTIEMALHKHAVELELRKTEERYRAVLESSFDAIMILEPDGRIVACNQRCATLFGHAAPREIVGNAICQFLAPHECTHAGDHLRRTIEAGFLNNAGFVMRRLDGTEFSSVVNARVIDGQSQKTKSILAVIRDASITPSPEIRTPSTRREGKPRPKLSRPRI